MNPRTAILILAAGESVRMGKKIKQLLPWKGTTLLEHAINTAKTTTAYKTLVVLGAHSDKIKAEIAFNSVAYFENKEWARGMGSSIAAGTKCLREQCVPLDGILIMLCDQPLIDSNHLNEMIRAFSTGDKNLIVTGYSKGVGVPALLSKNYFSKLEALDGASGAREILEKNIEDSTILVGGKREIDIDTHEDYLKLLKQFT